MRSRTCPSARTTGAITWPATTHGGGGGGFASVTGAQAGCLVAVQSDAEQSDAHGASGGAGRLGDQGHAAAAVGLSQAVRSDARAEQQHRDGRAQNPRSATARQPRVSAPRLLRGLRLQLSRSVGDRVQHTDRSAGVAASRARGRSRRQRARGPEGAAVAEPAWHLSRLQHVPGRIPEGANLHSECAGGWLRRVCRNARPRAKPRTIHACRWKSATARTRSTSSA